MRQENFWALSDRDTIACMSGQSAPKGSLSLMRLREGMPGLPSELGGTLASCAAVCLEEEGHSPRVQLRVAGVAEAAMVVEWETVTSQMRRGYADPDEATEFGAAAVAILLTKEIVGFSVVQRSWKRTGFDYWLGDENDDPDLPLNYKARLEVSGIRRGNPSTIKHRLQTKEKQTERSDSTGLPAFVSVVEFGQPFAFLVKR